MWICCLLSHVAEAVPTLQDGWAWAKQGVTERRLNELDGLAHHHATGLVQDKQGMIWVATWNGLSRYDGYRFVSFKPKAGDGCSMGVNRIKDIRIRDPYIYCNAEGYCFVFDIRTGRFDDSHLSWNKALRNGLLRSGNETAEDSRRSGVGSGLSGRKDELPQAVLCYVAVEATRMSGEGTLPRPRGTDMGVLARRCLCENLRRQSESSGISWSRRPTAWREDSFPVGCVHDVARRGRQPMVGMQTWWTVASVAPCRRQLRHQPNSACNPW